MSGPEEILKNVQAADEASYKSQLAFLNGPEVYHEYIKEQFEEIRDRLEKEYAKFVDSAASPVETPN